MLDQDLDDAHLCIKCNATIEGLENYINHRKINCITKSIQVVNRGGGGGGESVVKHAFESTFAFTEPIKTEKPFNFSYEIISSQAQQQQQQQECKDENTSFKTDKPISEDYNYGLGADVFFSSLELQSSTKPKPSSAPSTSKQNTLRLRTRKSATASTHSETAHDDEWINEHTGGTDKLLKAVSDISGTKKVDSMFSLIRFQQDSPDPYDDEDDDDDDDGYHIPSRTHTGGKWKPHERPALMTSSPHWDDREQWEMVAEEHSTADEFAYDINPPPSYTKGKWVPGTKIAKLDYKPDPMPSGSLVTATQFWCSTCQRKLSSRVLYERHLKTNLHMKLSKSENELDEASAPLPRLCDNMKPYETRAVIPSSTVTKYSTKKSKRFRRKCFIKCGVCNTRLRRHLLGKHLISHYHYRRMCNAPSNSYDLVLNNMSEIVLQSPFQCKPCRFYANTEEMFMKHWTSKDHTDLTEGPGRFWCSFCKFECEDNNQMRRHLVDEDHQDLMMAINRSFPIIIRKRTIITCTKCSQEFHYNIQLRKHSEHCSSAKPLGTASNEYQSRYRCNECSQMLQSRKSLQIHKRTQHSIRQYFCNPCELIFISATEAKKHRMTTEHKVRAARRNRKKNLSRKCNVCNEVLLDVLKLKEHRLMYHTKNCYR